MKTEEMVKLAQLIAEAIRSNPIPIQIVKSKGPARSRKSIGRGKQTAYMKKQRKIFDAYLESHPITMSSKSSTLAHRCWLEHKTEWDAKAKDGSGYADYKSLARAV